jgi:SAM-dependent methyltransferase
MVRIGLIYVSFYKAIKEKIWETAGIKLLHERDHFLLDLVGEHKELKFFLTNISSFKYSLNYSLDIGCGKANLTKKISNKYNFETIGIDIGRSFFLEGNARFLTADASLLPFKLKSFVLVTAFSLIEHIREDCRKRFFEEVKEVLADDGVFVMQFPNRYFPIEQHSFLPFVGYLPSRLHSLFYHSYVSVPSKKRVVEEMTKQGFKIEIIKYGVPFLGFSQNNLFSKIFPFGFLIVAKKS